MKLNFNQQQQTSPNQDPATNSLNIENLQNKLNTNTIDLKFTSGQTYNLDQLIFYKRRNNASCPLIVQVRDSDSDDRAVIEKITKMILNDYGISYTDANYKDVVCQIDDFSNIFDTYFNQYYKYYYDKLNSAKVSGGTLILNDILSNIQNIHDGVYDNLISTDKALTYAGDENEYNKPQVEFEFGNITDDPDNEAQVGYQLDLVEDTEDHSNDELVLSHNNESYGSVLVDKLFENHGLKLGESDNTAFSGSRGLAAENNIVEITQRLSTIEDTLSTQEANMVPVSVFNSFVELVKQAFLSLNIDIDNIEDNEDNIDVEESQPDTIPDTEIIDEIDDQITDESNE